MDSQCQDNGFLPMHADKGDLELLERCLEMQSNRQGSNEIELLFSLKTDMAKSSVLSVISRIKERILIKGKNIDIIERSIGIQNERLFKIENLCSNTFSPDIINIINEIEKYVLELEKEKREQETSCWQDIEQLRKDLIFVMSDYKVNVGKRILLSRSAD